MVLLLWMEDWKLVSFFLVGFHIQIFNNIQKIRIKIDLKLQYLQIGVGKSTL